MWAGWFRPGFSFDGLSRATTAAKGESHNKRRDGNETKYVTNDEKVKGIGYTRVPDDCGFLGTGSRGANLR